MTLDVKAAKVAMRAEIIARLSGLPESERTKHSGRACALLEQQELWHNAHFVLMFAPLPGELDIWPLVESGLATGKVIALPRFDPVRQQYEACRINELAKDLEVGRYGIREPCGHCQVQVLNQLDFVLVPGVAFDLHGRRLGRGKGYYDRMLAQMCGRTCGVAFDEQIVREVPVDPHDSDVNCILTPTRWIEL